MRGQLLYRRLFQRHQQRRCAARLRRRSWSFQRAAVGTPSTATNVTTIVNDIVGCNPHPGRHLHGVRKRCRFDPSSPPPPRVHAPRQALAAPLPFPTTVTFTPAAIGGLRSGVITATEGNGNSGTATVTGLVSGPPDVVLSQTTLLAGFPRRRLLRVAGTAAAHQHCGQLARQCHREHVIWQLDRAVQRPDRDGHYSRLV